MRTTALGGLLATLVTLIPEAHAAGCAWQKDVDPLYVSGTSVGFRRTYVCPPGADGELKVELTARPGAQEQRIGEQVKTLRRSAKGGQPHTVSVRGGRFCPKSGARSVSAVVRRENGKAWRSYPVPVTAKVRGTGDLAALSGHYQARAYCRLCERGSLDIGFYNGRSSTNRLNSTTRLKGRATAPWFECARQGATLEMRFFGGADRKDASSAIRPFYVIKDLESKWHRKRDTYVMDIAVPERQLCKQAAQRNVKAVTFEVQGQGELASRYRQGRQRVELRCH